MRKPCRWEKASRKTNTAKTQQEHEPQKDMVRTEYQIHYVICVFDISVIYIYTHIYVYETGQLGSRWKPILLTGWQGKFRGLVLEAMWPTLFGADQWEPTQVSRGTMGMAVWKHPSMVELKMDDGLYVYDV